MIEFSTPLPSLAIVSTSGLPTLVIPVPNLSIPSHPIPSPLMPSLLSPHEHEHEPHAASHTRLSLARPSHFATVQYGSMALGRCPPPLSLPRGATCLLLLLLLLLFSSCCCSCWSASTASSSDSASTSEGTNAVVVSCSLTFDQRDAVNQTSPASPFWLTWQPLYNVTLPTVVNQRVVCPANCTTAALSNTSTPPLVSGSFPYSPSSSICLAAIHAGIIADAAGGGVLVSRFYRHDWSNTTNQTIYPHDSWRGSLSNGVRSGDVHNSSYRVPASSRDWSYTVRGRGEFVVQRRMAPFPPRAGHVHVSFVHGSHFTRPDGAYFHVQVVIGGHNDMAYLNDVWVATARLDETGEDMTWYRLPDAPFSPRSDVLATYDYSIDGREALYLLGGQIGHACGLRELGVCSNEIWIMQLAVNPSTGAPSVEWASASFPASLTARCGSALIAAAAESYDALILVGGQLSYNDSSCSSPPVTVNEQWSVNLTVPSRLTVVQLPDAPFSPRRWSSVTALFSWGQDAGPTHYPNAMYASLIGGYRLLNVSRAVDGTGRLQLASMELSADCWECGADGGCQQARYNGSLNGTMVPPLSVPVPTAFSPITADSVATGSVSFGGVMPRAAVEQWRATRPVVERAVEDVDWHNVAANVTQVRFSQVVYFDYRLDWPTAVDSFAFHLQLPLTAVMDEDELDDPTGDYALGSGWTLSYSGIERWAAAEDVTAVPSPSATLYQRPRAFADSPDNSSISSWWTPMAASSTATRRPLLNFDLRRRDHRSSSILHWLTPTGEYYYGSPGQLTPSTWTSGGRSGSRYYNDVVLSLPLRCPLPDDPSYRSALGPMHWQPPLASADTRWKWAEGTAEVGTMLVGYCASGYHLEPPLLNSYVWLHCRQDGMWMDIDSRTVLRCVRDEHNCTWPLVDLGLAHCQPVLPLVYRVRASYPYNGETKPLTVTDDVVLSGLPPRYGEPVLMSITGNLFVEPVRIFIHGEACQRVSLDSPHQLCYNASVSSDQAAPHYVCDRVSRKVSCEMPALFGVDMDVIVLSGRGAEVAETRGFKHNDVITITTAAPAISRLESADCRASEQSLSLVDCPVNRTTSLTICAASDSIMLGDVLQVVLSAALVGNCSFDHKGSAEFCSTCVIQPQYGIGLQLVLQRPTLGLRSTTAALLSFASCPAGTWLDKGAVGQNATNLCVTCPAGSSTMGNTAQAGCTLCPAGTSSDAGNADCTPCATGYYSSSSNSTHCSLCPLNSYANDTRQTGCQLCSLNDYIVYAANHSHARPVDGECVACPVGSTCTISGNILSARGQYLLIDQQAATVSGIRCSSSACMSAVAQCPQADDSDGDGGSRKRQQGDQEQQPSRLQPQSITASQLRVVNCCGAGRWPAYINTSAFLPRNSTGVLPVTPGLLPDGIVDTDGVNVLCAHCLPGHSNINGRCVACSSVRWARCVVCCCSLCCSCTLCIVCRTTGRARPHSPSWHTLCS